MFFLPPSAPSVGGLSAPQCGEWLNAWARASIRSRSNETRRESSSPEVLHLAEPLPQDRRKLVSRIAGTPQDVDGDFGEGRLVLRPFHVDDRFARRNAWRRAALGQENDGPLIGVADLANDAFVGAGGAPIQVLPGAPIRQLADELLKGFALVRADVERRPEHTVFVREESLPFGALASCPGSDRVFLEVSS